MSILKKSILISLPILSLLFGLLIEEDLSTGGSKNDFINHALPVITDFSNFIFNTRHENTSHFPMHYILLSIPKIIFENILVVKLTYFIFSLLLPFLVYINIYKLYPKQKFNASIIGLSILFLPFYRVSAFWPNAHLTALIFLLLANYFYILSLNFKNFKYKFIVIFFLSLSTYSMQSYVVFFIYYLFNYYKNEKLKTFASILFLCAIFSLPGIYLILETPTGNHDLNFTNNLSYTVITNFSITLFFLLFFISNKDNFIKIKNFFIELNKYEILSFLFLFTIMIFNYENNFPFGGGFFYKFSNILFNNNYLFFLTSIMGLIISYLFYKIDKNIFYTIILVNFTAIGYTTSQKYFEPIFLVLIFVICKNFLSKNIIKNNLNTSIFYFLSLLYFVAAFINNNFDLFKL